MNPASTYTAFSGPTLVASGPLRTILRAAVDFVRQREALPVLIFEDATGRQVDFDLRGTVEEVLEREAPETKHDGPGRPRLGVVSREVTLLPRHWEWLEGQPAGASAAIRRLVDEARLADPAKEKARLAVESAHRFMTAMAGDRAGYEEALRALYRGDGRKFASETKAWPADVRDHARRMAAPALGKAAGRKT
ncbi:MAG: DUF2239 family protein [Planctomycetes bacterium]|nr:DUF2239 family protein [Planctomycetota bacterium]